MEGRGEGGDVGGMIVSLAGGGEDVSTAGLFIFICAEGASGFR